MGFVLWFEPERVQPGTWLFEQHPDWLIVLGEQEARRHEPWAGNVDALLNLGNPEFEAGTLADSAPRIYKFGAAQSARHYRLAMDFTRRSDSAGHGSTYTLSSGAERAFSHPIIVFSASPSSSRPAAL
jgi:hypothetical protein